MPEEEEEEEVVVVVVVVVVETAATLAPTQQPTRYHSPEDGLIIDTSSFFKSVCSNAVVLHVSALNPAFSGTH